MNMMPFPYLLWMLSERKKSVSQDVRVKII